MNRVLVVDDEPMALMGTYYTLSRARQSLEIELAIGAEEAVELLELGREFDLLICDLRMPGMDGVRLLEYVHDKHPDVLRIAVTGNADCEQGHRAGELCHLVLEKPYHARALQRVVREVLDAHPGVAGYARREAEPSSAG
jgi:CheY-like chemotaxis protein